MQPLGLTIVQHLPSKNFTASDIKRGLDEISAKVHQRGYEIVSFASDPGSVFYIHTRHTYGYSRREIARSNCGAGNQTC